MEGVRMGIGLRIGELQRVGDFHLSDPVVRATRRARYGDRIPLEEPAIAPAAMLASRALVIVAAR